MPYASPTYKPVAYVTVTDKKGTVQGYLWFDDADRAAGWVGRAERGGEAARRGDFWMAKLDGAEARGLAPTDALAELFKADTVYDNRLVEVSLTNAASLREVHELAVQPDPEDRLLLGQLKREDPSVWRELADAAAALTPEDRAVAWKGAGEQPGGVMRIGYPDYSRPLMRLTSALVGVGAVTPAHFWMDHRMPEAGADGQLPPADAVRAATAIVRGERFSDGTIAQAARDGLLDAVAASLLAWYSGTGK
ncbi:hypothetical protein H9Y04_27810 [Streptomyces sp. TRM66268-LWL]|uniref:Uncharacterized protein n=1 Tax=Streptomyces polyasparticus TaxID=2767826 RepID=A0ABR7SLN7_9ACTN|nr:DUF6508 domain-containing protein [Streptomyces polyasparticus]MBC9716347.1 hypothetical protein [Streptomyces polyasparticus]